MGLLAKLRGRPKAPEVVAVVAEEEVDQPEEPVDIAVIPEGIRTAAGWSWRLLVIAAAFIGTAFVIQHFTAVTIPIAVAVLLTALLSPLAGRLRGWGWHPALAAAVSLIGMILLIAGVLAAVGRQVAVEMPALVDQTVNGSQQLLDWLAQGPLAIDQAQIDQWFTQLKTWLTNSRAEIARYAGQAGTRIGHFFAGFAIALIATFFFTFEGRGIWRGTVNLLPRMYRVATDDAASKGWASLVAYMRAQVLVALVDALGVLIAALILRVPMAWALFALTFFTAFIPVVGAVSAGFVAVVLALVTHGWVPAVIMLASVILVMQLEGHVLQPFLLGRAVSLHPLAVLVGLAIGAELGGIVGALLVIPILAFGVAFIRALMNQPEEIKPRRLAEESQN